MNANELTFGVEIECYVPVNSFPIGAYHRGVQIAALPPGWNAQHDGSLYTRRRGFEAVEIVSPILTGADGMRQVKAAVQYLKSLGATVNARCGFHVHIGVGQNRKMIATLTSLASNFQSALYAITGSHNRERGSYCQPIRDSFRNIGLNTGELRGNATDRFHLLNLSNLITGSKRTVEFRVFAGTVNWIKAAGYITVCLAMAEKASKLKRLPVWNGVTPVDSSTLHRKGVGLTQLTRLFYSLGWTKGDRQPIFGLLAADDLPSIDEYKRVFRRLARKYDAGA